MRDRFRSSIPTLVALTLVASVAVDPLQAETVRVRFRADEALAARSSSMRIEAATASTPRDLLLVVPRGHAVSRASAIAFERVPFRGDPERAAAAAEPAVEVLGSQAWYGYQIACVRVDPVVAGAHGLEVATDIEVRLETAPGGSLPMARQRLNLQLAAREAALVRESVANPSDMPAYAPPLGRAVTKRGAFQPAAFPDLEGSDVEYVIVTSAALAPAFQQLADWKTRRGVPTIVRTVESIQATYRNGSDVQETIRTFLQDAYQKWSVSWALLGGDTEIIPARYLSSSFAMTTAEQIPCDLYFAGLDGTFNKDGDAFWGEAPATGSQPDPDEADLLAELYLSRLAVVTPAQVSAYVQKVIAYETPYDATYQDQSLFLGEVLFPTNWDTTLAITMDGAQLSEDIVAQRFPPSAEVRRRYEDYNSFLGALPLTRALTLADLNTGYNLVNHVGHGFRYNMSVGDQSIVNSDVDGLTNTNRYSVVNILNCTSLAFDYPCLAEHLLNNPTGGAVSVVGASRSAYPLPAREYQDEYYDLLMNYGVWRVGELFGRSHINLLPLALLEGAHRWTFYIYNMLGDAELAVYSAQPALLAVSHPTSTTLGTSNHLLHVAVDGSPVAGARVCLQKGDDDYQVGWTGPDGNVTLAFRAESAGTIDVTVSGRNLQTYLGSISVGSGAGSYVHLQSIGVDDDASGGTSGNGDGVLDAGETVDLQLVLRNDGGSTSSAVVGTVSVVDPYVTVVAGSLATGALAPAGSAPITTPVRLQISPTAPDGHAFELQLDLTAGAEVTQDRVRKVVHAPVLRVVRLEVLDDATGNGNGTPDEGEVFELRAWVKNYGSGRVDGLNALLQTSSFNVTILQGTASYGSIMPMVEGANATLFQLQEDFLDQNRIDLRLTDNRGRLVVHGFEMRRPSAPFGLALDPSTASSVVLVTWPPAPETDTAGYHVYRALAAGGPWTRASVDYTRRITYFRDTGLLSSTRYYYSVTSVDSSGNESLRSPVVSISTSPPQVAGWPIQMAAETSSSPAVGDLDGDGLLEVVQGNSFLYAWHGNGIEVLDADADAQTWGVFSTAPTTVNAAVVLAELDGTPGLEVVACNWADNKIFVIDGDGTTLWMRHPQNGGTPGYWGTPACGDVDRDGRNEVFAVSKDGRVYAWNHDGSPLLAANPDGRFATVAGFTRSSPAIGNLDADFDLEIVLTDVMGGLFVWNPDGSSLPGFPKAYGVSFYNSPVLGDVDGDGRLEIVAVSQSGSNNVHCLRGDGTELPGFPFTVTNKSAAVSPSPALADFDSDGRLEIVIAANDLVTTNSKVHVYRHNGTVYPGWPQLAGSDSESSPVVGDFDGDGVPDIAHGGQGGVLRGWRANGVELVGFPLTIGDFVRATPTVADIDADGDLDLVIASWDKSVYVWDFAAAWNAASAPWPTFLHDSQRTGLYGFDVQDATDAGREPAIALPPVRVELSQNHPNPFNPSTIIEFALPQAGPVLLRVFDVRGSVVRTLVETPHAAGRHRVVWDGRDTSGRRAASGVYLYEVRSLETVLSRRMVLLK